MKMEVRVLDEFEDFLATVPEVTRQAASLAFNTIIPRKGMAAYKKAIRAQVGFPGGYLNNEDKFGVTQFARPNDLEVTITARQRQTSLARFAVGGTVGTPGVRLKGVGGPGSSNTLERAWLVRLRAGTMLNDESFNLGLAVRVPGGRFKKKRDTSRMVHLAKDVFLLYGPSVDQVFRSVAVTETPMVVTEIRSEFYRQFARLS